MANRSYLYSTNYVPGSAVIDDRRAVGIAEWSYDIPIVFKLLLSGDPRTCASLIFEGNDEIALVGPYEKGVANMLRFLDRVPHPAAMELKAEAQEFLAAEENKNPYFVFEGGEVFGMVSESLPEENRKLLAELTDLEPQMQKVIANIEARVREETHPPGLFARLFGGRTPVRREDSSDLVHRVRFRGLEQCTFLWSKAGVAIAKMVDRSWFVAIIERVGGIPTPERAADGWHPVALRSWVSIRRPSVYQKSSSGNLVIICEMDHLALSEALLLQ